MLLGDFNWLWLAESKSIYRELAHLVFEIIPLKYNTRIDLPKYESKLRKNNIPTDINYTI